ncbi:MAG: hypothetical protein RhofKO_29040 [Rhodothermales bacterium]
MKQIFALLTLLIFGSAVSSTASAQLSGGIYGVSAQQPTLLLPAVQQLFLDSLDECSLQTKHIDSKSVRRMALKNCITSWGLQVQVKLIGSDAAESLVGSDAADSFDGGDGPDYFDGGDGPDYIVKLIGLIGPPPGH